MRPITTVEHRLEVAEGFFPPTRTDPFEGGRLPRLPRLNTCMGCHARKGIDETQTVINVGYAHFRERGGPGVISRATVGKKREHKTWKALRELWR